MTIKNSLTNPSQPTSLMERSGLTELWTTLWTADHCNRQPLASSAGDSTTLSSRSTPRGAASSLQNDPRTQTPTPSSGETPLPPFARQTTWQRQLLAVDFRHAFWPWVVFLAGLGYLQHFWLSAPADTDSIQASLPTALIIVGLSAAAVAVRIFCTDFGNNTAERLLACPVPRFTVWYLRLLLTAALLIVPALGLYSVPGLIPIRLSSVKDGVYSTAEIAILIAWCSWCFGPLWSLVLRRPILVYAPVVLGPAYVLFVAALINRLERWDFFVIAVILGLAAQFLAAILWRRLEVRQ